MLRLSGERWWGERKAQRVACGEAKAISQLPDEVLTPSKGGGQLVNGTGQAAIGVSSVSEIGEGE